MPRFILTTVSLLVMLTVVEPCLAQDNPTARENRLPGTQNWVLKKWELGETNMSEPIQGFASKTSVEVGESIDLHVSVFRSRTARSSAPANSFMVEVYRMGYYGGAGGRLMTTIGPLEGRNLTNQVFRSAAGAWESDWPPAYTLKIPREWISGVYLAKLIRLNGGFESYIIFVVTERSRASDFLFQVSDMTWQAYNNWPVPWESSLYEDRIWENSFNRPYGMATRNPPSVEQYAQVMGSGQFLHWEYGLCYFMESQGYDVTYCSQMDVHYYPDLLLNHRCWISVGHDEYWSVDMYNNVTRARDRGVNLAFFSGNIMSGEFRFRPSYLDGEKDRVFSRHHAPFSDAALVGAGPTFNASGDWVVNLPDHWIFAGTDLKKGDRFLNLAGWEVQANPADYPTMEVVGQVKVYRGRYLLTGSSTLYSVPSGAMVFNASSIFWSLGLADWPGRTVLAQIHVDERVRHITRNVLDRFKKGPAAKQK
jgi:hypothetical protein